MPSGCWTSLSSQVALSGQIQSSRGNNFFLTHVYARQEMFTTVHHVPPGTHSLSLSLMVCLFRPTKILLEVSLEAAIQTVQGEADQSAGTLSLLPTFLCPGACGAVAVSVSFHPKTRRPSGMMKVSDLRVQTNIWKSGLVFVASLNSQLLHCYCDIHSFHQGERRSPSS